jgi:hypothetical protein
MMTGSVARNGMAAMQYLLAQIADSYKVNAEISKLKSGDLKMYRKSMRNIDERQLAIDCVAEESEAKGIAIGRKEGRVEGFI